MKAWLGTISVVATAAALGVAAILFDVIEQPRKRSAIQFEGSTAHPFAAVQQCLKSGNGSKIFAAFKYVSHRAPSAHAAATYLDSNGDRLTVKRKAGRTLVVLTAQRPPQGDARDLLEWCIRSPQTTWIPQKYRGE